MTDALDKEGLAETPQDRFARWLNEGPRLAKEAGVYVGIKVTPAPDAARSLSPIKESGNNG